MTEPRLTHARVWRLALPLVLSNATVPLVGLVDTAVVGQLGQAAPIGAVAIGASMLNAFYWIFGFLRMGTTGMAAQAIGAGDRPETVALLSRALLIGLIAGLSLILIQAPLFALAFATSPASAEVQSLAQDYVAIRIWSAPAIIATYGLTGWLIAAERTGPVLAIQIATNGVNIALDLWLVLGLGWGVSGVAWATYTAEWTGLALGLWLCRDAFASPAWRDRARVFDPARLRTMAAVNRDIMIRSVLMLAIVVSFVFHFSPRFGEVPLAANQILMQFISLTVFALDGFAFAAESFVGQALGARNRARLRRAAGLCCFWGLVVGAALSACFGIAGGLIIDQLTTAADVRAQARSYLPWMVINPLLGATAWILDGIFIGATRGRDMRNMMALSAATYLVAALVFMELWGNQGLWAALSVSYIARAVTLGSRYPSLERAADAA